MEKYWRRFAGWVIGLKDDPFNRARFKITVIFTLIIVSAQIFYLGLLYREFSRESQEFANQNIAKKERRTIFLKRASAVSRATLFSIQYEDVGMFFIVIGISYFMAGVALRPIREILRKQRQYLADTSHELKTPLTIIKTEMEVFLRSKKNRINNSYLIREKGSIKSNLEEIERMQHIINNLLTLSKIEYADTNFHFAPMSLEDSLNKVIEKLRGSAVRKGIKLNYLPHERIILSLDRVRIGEAWYNLLFNAIKYTKPGGSIRVKVTKNEKHAIIYISDTGIGIAKEDLPRIFERFFRSNSEFTKRISGTGLGLAITKLIITKHKGMIDIHSELNKGTTVSTYLPLN